MTAVRVTLPPVFNFFPSLVTTKVNAPLPEGIVVVVVVLAIEDPLADEPAGADAPGAKTVSE